MTSPVTQRSIQKPQQEQTPATCNPGKGNAITGTYLGKYTLFCTSISGSIAAGICLKGASFTAVTLTAAAGPVFAIGSIAALVAYDAFKEKQKK